MEGGDQKEEEIRNICCFPTDDPALPERVSKLYEVASEQLEKAGKGKYKPELEKSLRECQDAFAHDEYDLGTFQVINHQTDTGDAAPIKLGLRRTPVHFVKEEEALLEKMVQSGGITASSSSWAVAPVLVRKKMGQCVGALIIES